MPPMQAALIARKKAKYVDALRRGATHELASDYSGLSRAGAYNWRKAGEDGDPAHVEFYEQCLDAMGSAGMDLVDLVKNAAQSDWKAGAWFLERRFPKQWSRNERREIAVAGTVPVVMDAPGAGDVAANMTRKDPSDD